MKKILLVALLVATHSTYAQQPALKLWYRQPATKWMEALPVGNGRLGAMVYSDPQHEIIQVNEESLWAGVKYNDANPNSLRTLDSVRQLLFQGKSAEASALARPNMIAVNAENSSQLLQAFRSYQTLMNVHILLGNKPFTNYRRELDLTTGVVSSTTTIDGVTFRQEVFSSAPGNTIAVKITASKPAALNATFYLDRPDDRKNNGCKDCSVSIWQQNKLLLSGQIDDKNPNLGPEGKHMKFAGAISVFNDGGQLKSSADSLIVSKASSITFYIDGATNYDFANLSINDAVDPVKNLSTAIGKYNKNSFGQLKAAEIKDHSTLMNRVNFQLADKSADIPTDERLEKVKAGAYDPHLTTLLFQYSRYLLIGSSRAPGVLPANLQGIWNDHINAPWQADFHTNINLQMNYWQAETGDLPETVLPMISFIDHIREQGRITAKKMYGARGWVMHHATDAFGKTGLQNEMFYGTFPMGTTWMLLHFWDHYDYNRNIKFLADTAYPAMYEHALFIKDFLVRSPEGYLVTAPAYSPENSYKDPVTGKPESLTYGPTMDNQIIREFLTRYIAAAGILHKDAAFADSLRQVMAQLPPTRLGKDGRILEWVKEYEETEPGHRHVSHLFALYPGSQINDSTPALLEGARKTLEYRLAHGGGHTGWSRAWIINFYARLKDGEKVYENVQALFKKSIYTNLFDDHPPFQIDGNFGSAAGITEALVQSTRDGHIELLPALPAAWSEGRLSGIKTRGGFHLDMSWKGHKLTSATLTSATGEPVTVTYNGKSITLQPAKGQTVALKGIIQ
ncbi:glycoside hydrolase N-terminal domain-containing protein [Chitinophaga sp. Cy-1792]|uniref:glycosyl hydrolase family 95 catalytic domain-containing protein n=1 Tax=Chitinophaga sp. Cy-1792 TaxID=2608339 RepID=UPI00141FC4F9|nr:glycoside hydrolase N-terminal domain-containing protein [Chitinophaga sp. Cy-1792]NIG57270.1 glycoside hydrolase family 95 protein [Chitinophaga sp. Cy-1792]